MKKILLLFIVMVLSFACKKDLQKLPEPDGNGYIWLRVVKSLPLIKKTIQGKWRIRYQYGGITGQQKTELSDSWFQFKPNDSMYIIFEGSTYAATKPNFVRKETQFGYEAWVLDFEFNNAWELRDELVIDLLIKDSLWLIRNSPDPLGYLMAKVP